MPTVRTLTLLLSFMAGFLQLGHAQGEQSGPGWRASSPISFSGWCKVSLSKSAIRSDETVTITCRVAQAGHIYVGSVDISGHWDSVGNARWDGVLGPKDTVELQFTVKPRIVRGISYGNALYAGVAVSTVPFGDLPDKGFVFDERVGLLDFKEINDSAEAVQNQIRERYNRINQEYFDYLHAHPDENVQGGRHSETWLQGWKEHILKLEHNDSTAIYEGGALPVFPRPGEKQK